MRAGGPSPGGALRVGCWGCGRRLAVPAAPGAPPGCLAEQFRCGWCGAVSALAKPGALGEARIELPPPGPGGGARPARRAGRGRRWGERALVGAVAVLVAGLALGGFRLLAGLRGSQLVRLGAGALLAVLVANVYFNYACAVLRKPEEAARLRAPPPPPGPAVAHGSLEGFRFCAPCAAPKHPRDHHCRVCRRCVVEMDHHCPFIANCVGRHNLRHFLLFLLYACLGLAEVVAVAVAAFLQAGAPPELPSPAAPERWPPSEGTSVSPGLGGAGGLLLRTAAAAAARGGSAAAAAALLTVLAGALGLALAALLVLQLKLAAEGASAIDNRQQAPPTGGGLRRVFGAGNPLTWALPALAAPRGTPGGDGSWGKEA